MRAIVRFSLNLDRDSTKLRSSLHKILEGNGFRKLPNTSTYEGRIGNEDVGAAMAGFWKALDDWPHEAHLDHFWMYVDDSEEAETPST